MPVTPSTSSRDPAARAEVGGRVRVVGLLDIHYVVGYVADREHGWLLSGGGALSAQR